MIVTVIPLNQMTPSSYNYDERDGSYQLSLGGVCTIAGLKLFPANARTPEVKIYGDSVSEIFDPSDNLTTTELISQLSADYIGLHDFSCTVEPDCQFSTHDDAECYFDAGSKRFIHELFCRITPPVCSVHLWATLQSNCGCYVAVDEQLELNIFSTFDALLKHTNAG